jgi:hypothetical protein
MFACHLLAWHLNLALCVCVCLSQSQKRAFLTYFWLHWRLIHPIVPFFSCCMFTHDSESATLRTHGQWVIHMWWSWNVQIFVDKSPGPNTVVHRVRPSYNLIFWIHCLLVLYAGVSLIPYNTTFCCWKTCSNSTILGGLTNPSRTDSNTAKLPNFTAKTPILKKHKVVALVGCDSVVVVVV